MAVIDTEINAGAIRPIAAFAPVHDADQDRMVAFQDHRPATVTGARIGGIVRAFAPAGRTHLIFLGLARIFWIARAVGRDQIDFGYLRLKSFVLTRLELAPP